MNSSQHSGHLHWINSWIETFWAHCSGKFTVWLHLDIFSPMEDALPQTTRLLDIWKAGFAMKASQHSGHILDQTSNRHSLSPLQWFMVLPDSNWPRLRLWKTLYHGQQGPLTLGQPVLPRTAVSVLAISTDQAKFCTFSLHILLLLVYSAFWYWLRWLQCNWFFHGRLL